MTDYWIKLYHEIIDDPKMATLPDRLWRRTIEIFLLAGRLCLDKSGKLPDTRQLAWLLRMPTDELQGDLDQLASTGIIESIPGGWLIVNFEKRQSAASPTERVQRHRERKHKEQYYGSETENETDLKRKVTQINRDRLTETESETETTTSSSEFGELCRAYEHNIGLITPMTGDMLEDDLDAFGLQLCLDAILVAVGQNKRKWAYVRGVLRNWQTDGRGPNKAQAHISKAQKIVLPSGEIVEAQT